MQVRFPNLNFNPLWFAVVNFYSVLSSFQCPKLFLLDKSFTALQWISLSDKRLPVFVANRVAEIIDGSNVEQWNFVPGQIIPADIGTRGIEMSEIENTDWLRGLSFLKLDKSKWPEKPQFVDSVSSSSVCSEKSLPNYVLGKLFRKVSSFRKLKRIVAFVLKVRSAHHKSDSLSNPVLTVDDLARAKLSIWTKVQLESFSLKFCLSPLIMLFPVTLNWHLLSHF